MGRSSREVAAENRARVVATASSLFRRKGFDGAGIDELMAESGLTRGGFYRQFGSKEQLAAEAYDYAFDAAKKTWSDTQAGDRGGRLSRLTKFYLAPKPPGSECPMATLAGDAARAAEGSPIRRAFGAALRHLATLIVGEKGNEDALAVMAAMVGAVALRRASDDTELAAAIDAAVLRLAERSSNRKSAAR